MTTSQPKRVALFGATGKIGRQLLDQLLAAGHDEPPGPTTFLTVPDADDAVLRHASGEEVIRSVGPRRRERPAELAVQLRTLSHGALMGDRTERSS